MRRFSSAPILPLLGCLAFGASPAVADVILEGFHLVPIQVCYTFADSAGHVPVVVVRPPDRHYRYVPIADGQCVDQGYKFSYAFLYWADRTELAKGLPDSTTKPEDVSWMKPIRCLSGGGYISNNHTQYPDSIPITDETWTYTIVGGETAVTTIVQRSRKDDSTSVATLTTFDYLWGGGATRVHSRQVASGLSLRSVRGSKVRLTIPEGTASLRVFTLTGRLLRQMRILPTGGHQGEVDLGMVPPVGSFVELRQGARSSVVPVVRN